MPPDQVPGTGTIDEQRREMAIQALLDAAPPAAEPSLSDLVLTMANALGTAWATYQMYPDPRGRIGFDRALQDLAGAPGIEYLEVGSRAFIWDRAEVPATHAGTERIVDRLFVNRVAIVQFLAAPSADDLLALFEVIRRTPDDLDEMGGAASVLRGAGVHSVRLLERRTLSDVEEEDDAGDGELGGTADPTDYAGDPEALAAALLEKAGGDPAALASLVVESYGRAHELIDPQDIWEREEIVHTFVDMFFYFPREYQAPLISEVLVRQDDTPFRIFLDQFASHELNELAPLLDAKTHPLLIEYAMIAGETADRSGELIGLLNESRTEDSIDLVVARRIEAVLTPGPDQADASSGSALARLADQRPDAGGHFATGTKVLQGLLTVVDSDQDTRRVLRIWAGKIAHAIRHRDPSSALIWLRAVSDADSLASPAEGPAYQALHRAMRAEVVAGLAEILHAAPDSVEARELLQRLAPHVTDHLIEFLGSEEDQGRRRALIEMVVEASRQNPAHVVALLEDPRWYLIRNLALILGRSQHPEVVEHLIPLTTHLDDRVRREALRAIYALTRDADIMPFIDGLADPHESVRKVAATILRTCRGAELAPALGALLSGPAGTTVKLDVITLLGTLGTDDARAVLEQQAQVRAGGWGATRALRSAARQVLGAAR